MKRDPQDSQRTLLSMDPQDQLQDTDYEPDCWVVLQWSGLLVPKTYHRVLAGWNGGLIGRDHWQLSSGVVEVQDCGIYWRVVNHSGSVYNCYKTDEGFNPFTTMIFNRYHSQNNSDLSCYRVAMEDCI